MRALAKADERMGAYTLEMYDEKRAAEARGELSDDDEDVDVSKVALNNAPAPGDISLQSCIESLRAHTCDLSSGSQFLTG